MIKSIITISLLFSTMGLFAQNKTMKSVEETQALSKNIVELFEKNKITESFEELKPFWPLPENEIASLEQKTLKYLNLIELRFGESEGTIKVKNEHIADIAIRETYLIRYEYTAIRLIFTYYKNNKGWVVNAFKWDDSYSDEFVTSE